LPQTASDGCQTQDYGQGPEKDRLHQHHKLVFFRLCTQPRVWRYLYKWNENTNMCVGLREACYIKITTLPAY